MNEQDKLNHIFAQVEAWRKSADNRASPVSKRGDTYEIGYWDGQVDAYTTVLALLHRVKFPISPQPDER